MKKNITNDNILKIIKKVINESSDDFVLGIASSDRTELIDDVINRINEHGQLYVRKLKNLNSEFTVEKYKRQNRINRSDFVLPPNVKVSKSIFPDE